MNLDLAALLSTLAAQRPIFHSEADFQHALAWELHRAWPEADVRLELPLTIGGHTLHLDLYLAHGGEAVAIELKYLKRGLTVVHKGEHFLLNNQGAQDICRYDCLKDVQRLERIVAARPGTVGHAIILTNDSTYWQPATGAGTADEAFRLHEDRTLHDRLAWGPTAGPGTTKDRAEPIELAGAYRAEWHDYADLGVPAGRFRYLCFTVG